MAIKKHPFVCNRHFIKCPFICINKPLVPFRANSGFTIIELITTLAVAAIVITFALPNLRTFILNSQMTTQTNALVSDISISRSEAIKSGSRVVICSSSNGTTCTSTGWSSGRLIYRDVSPFNLGPAPDRLVRYSEPLPGTIVAGTPNGFPDPLIFDSRGAPIDSQGRSLSTTIPMPILFTICESTNKVRGRQLSMNVTGQITTNPFSC